MGHPVPTAGSAWGTPKVPGGLLWNLPEPPVLALGSLSRQGVAACPAVPSLLGGQDGPSGAVPPPSPPGCAVPTGMSSQQLRVPTGKVLPAPSPPGTLVLSGRSSSSWKVREGSEGRETPPHPRGLPGGCGEDMENTPGGGTLQIQHPAMPGMGPLALGWDESFLSHS